jgi:hypothetical protein
MLALASAFALQGTSESVFLLPVLLEWFAIQMSLQRQSVADTIASTLVVESPPIQRHPAPAASHLPMDGQNRDRGSGDA